MARYLRPSSFRNINFININDLNFDRPATIADVKQETIAPTTTEKPSIVLLILLMVIS
jgi:hypothetical protein